MEELLKSLIVIQQNLNAPKDQYNKFGNFKYRSLEGILAAIKPLLFEQACGIRFKDEVVDRCGRTFLKTTLVFFNSQGQSIETTAEAEHSATKSGMDAAQITGAASSYARKYAMNSMFLIDDTNDADTDAYHQQTMQTPVQSQQPPRRMQSNKPMTTSIRTAPQGQSRPQYDRFAGIKKAIDSCQSVDALVNLYNQHKQEVESNFEILNYFKQKKQQLNAA